ncbi:MAG: type IV pilus assembly protein PilM, partial [Pseudomonadota bacterium]
MFFKSKKLIGLDIGSSTIKVAEIEVKKKKPILQGFAMYDTPDGSIAGGDIMDPESLAMAVQGAISELRSKTRKVATGLWGSSVILKKISVPRMDPELLREQIRYEAEQYIPYDVNEVNLEYKILNAVSNNPEAMEVLLVAAKQDNVLKYAEVILNAGFDCETLDVSGLAFANCFETNYGVV